MKRRREGLGLIWVGDVEQWKLREGSGRADQAGSAAPKRETLKLGLSVGRRAAAEGRECIDYGVLFRTSALQYM